MGLGGRMMPAPPGWDICRLLWGRGGGRRSPAFRWDTGTVLRQAQQGHNRAEKELGP